LCSGNHTAAEIDERHVVPRPRDEDPGKPRHLACSQQANACRKLGIGGEAEGPVAVSSPPLRASHGKGRRGLVGRRRFGRRKRRHWLVVCGKRPWFRPNPANPSGSGSRAARQEASEVRSTTSRGAEQAPGEGSHGLRLRSAAAAGRHSASAGASGAKRGATRAGDALVAHPEPSSRSLAYPRWKSSRRNGARTQAADSEARASRSRAWVPQGARDN